MFDNYQKFSKDTEHFGLKDWAREYPDIVFIGQYTYGRAKIYLWSDETKLKIGSFCSVAPGVVFIMGGNHRGDWITTYPFTALTVKPEKARNIKGHPATKGDIVVGNDVWIGYGATILSGVNVGDGVIIGARCVVSKSRNLMQNGAVPPYSIIAGNPAKIIGYRFSQDIIDILLQIKWWDWPLDKIMDNADILCSSDINKFKQLSDNS